MAQEKNPSDGEIIKIHRYGVDVFGTIAEKLSTLGNFTAMVKELVQNADDEKSEYIKFDFCDGGLKVVNSSIFTDKDFERIIRIAARGKESESHKTGAFGIGFVSVFLVTDHPEVQSAGKKYVFHLEDISVPQYDSEIRDHTEFFLPWASNPNSETRRELRRQAVTKDNISKFKSELLESIPNILLFLRNLRHITVLVNGVVEIEYSRDDNNPPHRKVVQIIGNKSKIVREWLVYEFESSERDTDAIELNKESKIGIAFPLFDEEVNKGGMLYDFLPTGLFTGYKFHINGDFFPTSDRQRIILEGNGPKVNWNIKVIGNIGRFLVSCLSDLKTNLGIKLFEYLPDVDYNNANLPALNLIKNIFFQLSKNEEIIPDEAVSWYKHDCIFLIDTKDENERRTLAEIGIPIINSKLRTKWTLIQQGLGVKSLDLSTIIMFIQKKNIKAGVIQSEAQKPFNTIEGVYDTLLFLQDRLKTKSEEKFLTSFSQLPICPDQTGHLNQFSKLKLMTPSVEKAIPNLDRNIIVNSRFQSHCKDIKDTLLRLTPEFNWKDVIDFFHYKPPSEIGQLDKTNTINLMELYDYLANHESEILKDPIYRDKLIKSCIFMTNKQFKPLSGLCLSGNYKDIIGLDIIISEDILTGKVKDFLKRLGVRSLDFPTYVIKYVPDYFSNEEAWKGTDKRLDLAEEIRKNFSLISDNFEIRALLKRVKFIPCTDGVFHSPLEIYLKSDLLDIVFGEDYITLDATKIGSNFEGWIEWLKLLGVNTEPKSEDIIQRIRTLAAKWSPENIQAIEQLFYFLCDLFNRDDFKNPKQYEILKTISWIPVENIEGQYFIPSEVYLPFSKHLFFSQEKFVPFTQRGKMGGKFPVFLEIGIAPIPKQIIKHLLYLSEHKLVPENDPENIYNIYRELNARDSKIFDGEIGILDGSECVYIEGAGYQKARHCFWNDHFFGPFRSKAGDDLRNYFSFLKRVGVRDQPELDDYFQVLYEISEANNNKVVDESTKIIIKNIQSYFNEHINEITEEQLSEISGRKVILDRNNILCQPTHLFFEDKGLIVEIFKELLKNELISKESETWQLLQKMGVRHLSKAIQPSNFKPSSDQNPNQEELDLIRGRKSAIVTIVETQKKDFDDGWDIEFLDQLQIYDASHLLVKYEVLIDSHPISPPEREEKSFYSKTMHRLYMAKNCTGQDRTFEIARNIASILNPGIDPCHVLPVLVKVLDPSLSSIEVENYLRQVGYDIITISDSSASQPSPQDFGQDETEQHHSPGGEQEDSDGDDGETSIEGSENPGSEGTDPGGFEEKAGRLLGAIRRKRRLPGLRDETAEEINRKRKEWLKERLQHDYGTQPPRESEYTVDTHAMTPEEKEHHKTLALIFYNRQIQDLMSRITEIQEENGPENYSIYGPEWDELSKLVRERDGYTCRRCGLSEKDGVTLAVHHICPRKDGGSNWQSNLITLCRICHAEVEERPWLL